MHDKTSDISVPVEAAGKAAFDVAYALRVCLVLIPLALWIWLCGDWPTRLGFYSDDWMVLLHPFVGTAEAYRDILNLVATRPVSAPYIWLAQAFTDWSPARSQILNAAMLLLASISVGMLAAALSSVIRGLRRGVLVGACVASATFVVFPSNVGTFAWGTGVSTAIPALPLFCLSVSLLIHSENSWWRLLLGLVLGLLSHLSYEAFYFQEITLLLVATAFRVSTFKEIPWRALAGAILVNFACLAFNRLTPGGVQKSFHWDFFQIFIGGYSHLLGALGHATREYKFLILGAVLFAAPSGAICLARLIGALRVHLALLLVIGGVVASGFLYAFAGYGLAMEGPMARVGIVIATDYSIAAGALAAAAWCVSGQERRFPIVFYLFTVVSLVALDVTARARVDEWAETWTYELARLSRLPTVVTSAEKSPENSQRIYAAKESRPLSFLAPATASWEINGAIAWATYRISKSRLLAIDLWRGSRNWPLWFAMPSQNWFNRWNGQRFEQGFCFNNAVIYGAAGSELWLWDTSASTLTKVDPPWEFGCR
jgi:hypothetical protein